MKSIKSISFTSVVTTALLFTIALVLSFFATWQINFNHRDQSIRHEIAVNFASDKWAGFIDQCVLAARFDKDVPCTARQPERPR